ncbi:hypothetical protein BYT27DRAFT_6456918 [Phlegmacium glaucopus]|nr:hypothetical protein BYT27DRAFT_6456918 [Phlegmacium glaucopus]
MSQLSGSRTAFSSWEESCFYYAEASHQTLTSHRFPVLRYIETCGLPLVHVRGQPSLQQLDKPRYTLNWPKFHNLRRTPGVRLLTEVVSPGSANDLARIVKTYLRKFTADKLQQQSPAEGEFDGFLFLPCKNMKSYNKTEKHFLANIQNEDDFVRIVQQFVLGTITELVRIMERLPIRSPLAQDLKFKLANRLCPAHHARWDLFTLPQDPDNEIPLLVIFVPPWHFGHDDMKRFASVQQFDDGVLDTLDTRRHNASDIVWAIIYDVLKDRGYQFILTNYNRWVLGTLNQGKFTLSPSLLPNRRCLLTHGCSIF